MTRWKYRGRGSSKSHSQDDYDNDKLARYDKIRRKRDKQRKKKAPDMRFEQDELDWVIPDDSWFRARVVEVHKGYAFVNPEPSSRQINTRDVRLATVARKFLQGARTERNTVVVGDRVLCSPSEHNQSYDEADSDLPRCVIQNMAPRNSSVCRQDPLKNDRTHVLAANVDVMFIVASYVSPLVKWGLIDRYLVLAEEQNIRPVIILNKADLLAEESESFRERCQEQLLDYEKIGYDVLSLSISSAKENDPAIVAMKSIMKNRIAMFTGHSGVGKSSLINYFRPEIVQDVEPNSDIFYKGRHTTTYASLIRLADGAYVIDTPGIRSFILSHRGAIDLSFGFREFRPYLGQCKFRECRHIDEPGCSILPAVENGHISRRRYDSYCGLLLGDTGREGRLREDLDES